MADKYFEDELVPQKWMNEEFFQLVLESSQNRKFNKILNYNITPAAIKGDHYASIMFRAKIQYTEKESEENDKKEITLIIKTIPDEKGLKRDFLIESTFFEVEIQMYNDLIPKFEKMLRDVGDETILGAKLLYQSLTPRKVIVLEDITEAGFSVIGKRFVTVDELKMAIKKLTKWYACSYIMNEQNPGCFKLFSNGMYNLPGFKEDAIISKGLYYVIQLTKEKPQLQKYTDKLDKIHDKVLEKVFKTYETCSSQSKIQVLCHGDFHLKNLMFRFNPENNNLAEDVMLLDFQLCLWNSMALDVIYSIYMMMDTETGIQYEDEIVHCYFEEFQKNLKLLNYNGNLPKYSDFKADLDNLLHLHLFLPSTIMLYVALGQVENVDPNDLVNPDMGEDYYMTLYRSKYFVNSIEKLLKKLDHKGYLNLLLEEEEE